MSRAGVFWALMIVSGASSVANAETYTPGQRVDGDFNGFARPFLIRHCVDCHGETNPEGNLSLRDLGSVDEVNAAIWKSVWAQVALKEMPPKDAEQPGVVERLRFSDWIVGELSRVMKDKGGFRCPSRSRQRQLRRSQSALRPAARGHQAGADLLAGASLASDAAGAHHSAQRTDQHRAGVRSGGSPACARTAMPFRPTTAANSSSTFGTDNIIQWQGGTVAYATAVKSVPAVLASARNHGLKNYPDLYTVNSAEATQIMEVAGGHHPLHGLRTAQHRHAEQITDDPKSTPTK
jgi:hypothetical protein